MVVAVRRQNALHHMPAGRILTAMMQPTELDIAAIVPMDIRGTHTCKGLMDAKVMNTMSTDIYGFSCYLNFCLLNLIVGKNSFDFCLVSCDSRQDIDECSIESRCTHGCINMEGKFRCTCPSGMSGDGLKEGSGCKGIGTLQISIVAALALLLLLIVLGFWTHWLVKKRKLAKKRQRYFMQNGGVLLKQQMFSQRAPLRVFTSGELDKATNKFSDNNIVGRGGFGTVYKGILSDQMVVAIKRSQRIDQSQAEQFVNELVILSQVTHKNVVQLVGCCLETEVPLLVYEFIANGALFHHLHNTSAPLSWEDRLRIAFETASALAYLHLAAKMPIVHRVVKSLNILLDKSFTAKVSDLVPQGQYPIIRPM